tara:strand:+ start:250 stop:1083 length:834 start_codon:yes stop_codon:yes gene_type:complete
MAETLTYDAGTDTVTDGDGNNLTPAEQESLAVGEELVAQQEGLLAGKYKDAAELEKAYVELQSKLGEKNNKDSGEVGDTKDSKEVESEETTEETEETTQTSPEAELITSASEEFESKGELTAETIEKFSAMSSKDLVNAYMELQKNAPDQAEPVSDLSDASVNEVKNSVGGEEAYANIVNWAGENLDPKSIEAFDTIVNSGSVDAIKLAVSGLKSQYENSNGYEGKMYTGKAPQTSKDVFRSQAELVAAMSDRRYDRDPAYRQDVIEKLERSDNLSF